MEIRRLLSSDGSLQAFETNWSNQCATVGEDWSDFAPTPLSSIREFACNERNREWAVAIYDGDQCMAAAIAIKATQKPLAGWTLRIREVTVCPLLDYGNLDEDQYIDTLSSVLEGAIKLSESELAADHIKLHLRSPEDVKLFRVFRNILDTSGVFASTEAHGAWLILSKAQKLQVVE